MCALCGSSDGVTRHLSALAHHLPFVPFWGAFKALLGSTLTKYKCKFVLDVPIDFGVTLEGMFHNPGRVTSQSYPVG